MQSLVLIYWNYEINKLLQLGMIHKDLHWLQFTVQEIYPLKDEIYPQVQIYHRLRTTVLLVTVPSTALSINYRTKQNAAWQNSTDFEDFIFLFGGTPTKASLPYRRN